MILFAGFPWSANRQALLLSTLGQTLVAIKVNRILLIALSSRRLAWIESHDHHHLG